MNPAATTARRLVGGAYRRWHRSSLRTRLTTAAALAATLTIVAVIAVAYVAVRHQLRGQIDSQLRRQLHEVSVTTQSDLFNGQSTFYVHPHAGDIGGYVQVLDAHGQPANNSAPLPVSARDLQVAAGSSGRFLRDSTYKDQHVRIITAPLTLPTATAGTAAVQIALPLTEVDHQLHELALAFVVLALAGFGATVILSWAAVRRVTRPVQTLTEAAEQIAATRDLTLRIDVASQSELGRLARSFNTMLDALERSVEAQRQLVTDASHELRTPLASLRTNAEVLNDLERLSPDQRRAVLNGIVTQLDELTGLVADVVELARGEAPLSTHEDVSLDELVMRAVERARRHWPNVTFELTTVPTAVRGVPARLDRAVANVLDNAGKFSPAGGVVQVDLQPGGRLIVADRGPGVPEDALPHVFDRFFRADEARALPGSGLGLAIVQQIAQGHGGSISLTNRSGGGAIATLTISTTGVPNVAETGPAVPPSTVAVPVPVEDSIFR